MEKTDMRGYGFDLRFKTEASLYESFYAARITAQHRGLYQIICENGELSAVISGRFRHEALTPTDYPAVGDFVMCEGGNAQSGESAVIQKVLTRKSAFIRKAAGTSNEEQVVAANIDTVFICMSLNNDFNLRRLERYIAVCYDSGAGPVIVLTKSDLCGDLAAKISETRSIAPACDIIVCSALENDGCDKLRAYITPGKTAALIGSSGVGKSTLINLLLGGEKLATGGLRNDDKGHHTTTARELMLLPEGGIVMDTPGMRELGIWDSSEGIDRAFDDIRELSANCRFSDCTHTNEPGCAVIEALDDGTLSRERWLSYLKLNTEASFNEDKDAYIAQKTKKFKEIAKINKAGKKRR